MEEGLRPEVFGVVLQATARLTEDVFELVQIDEVSVGQGLVQERPELLARLKLRRVRRLEDQVDSFRDDQVLRGVPAGTIQHEDDAPRGAGADLVGEVLEADAHDGGADRGHQQREDPPGVRPDESEDIDPLVAGVVDGQGPVATERPGSPQDGLEPNSGLVLRPDFDLGVRMGTSDLQDLFA